MRAAAPETALLAACARGEWVHAILRRVAAACVVLASRLQYIGVSPCAGDRLIVSLFQQAERIFYFIVLRPSCVNEFMPSRGHAATRGGERENRKYLVDARVTARPLGGQRWR